jgi:hypothetical protein
MALQTPELPLVFLGFGENRCFEIFMYIEHYAAILLESS